MNMNNNLLICPICKSDLLPQPVEKAYRCENNHSFDVAKQGYVNLLTSNQKNSKLPGDSKEMVLARRTFLSEGHYEPLSDKINECVLRHLEAMGVDTYKVMDVGDEKSAYHILDIGCGEGYYTNALMKAARERGISTSIFGLDISKEAVKYASASNKAITWMVANSHGIPLEADTMDCILSVFSPVKISECVRLLKEDGFFLRVLPGTNHLIQLRDIIYEKVIINEEEEPIDDYEGLRLLESSKVTFDLALDNEGILSLIKMTPHYWKTSKADKEPLKELARLEVTIDMQINLYGK
jgi:23S rRNA (guanine745-N1)-methyltransferase